MSRKPTLTEQLAACNEAYLNWKTEAAMAEAYYLQLQEHLRDAHDCRCDFAVAEDPKHTHAEATPDA